MLKRCSDVLGLIAILTVVCVHQGYAHGFHVLSEAGRGLPIVKGPHEGPLRKVLSHHFELLMTGGRGDRKISVYLYDADMELVPVADKEGLLYLRFPDRTKRTVELRPSAGPKKEPRFEADLGTVTADSLNAVLSVKIGERRHNLRFSYFQPDDAAVSSETP